jgi:hypothetical protein
MIEALRVPSPLVGEGQGGGIDISELTHHIARLAGGEVFDVVDHLVR